MIVCACPQEVLIATDGAMSQGSQHVWLRASPLNSSALNGVQVTAGDKVEVLARVTSADGLDFVHIKAGRKKGYLRSEYCYPVAVDAVHA